MEKDLKYIKKKLDDQESISSELLTDFLSRNILNNRIEEYIGDYPTFIEPVVLGKNVIIGDDVLLGPNVYIGDNCEIGDYDEISNSIIFDNVKLGEIFKLDHCIVAENSTLTFKNLDITYSILKGKTDNKDDLQKEKLE
ncbi:MAG: UDP-3-O-(3-hydroxymyristoyl)glucosamine N-acyltransferase [Promethearchaeota archaeon]|nr:MAG: UDP-3-O-(3-hydroxymyristoyl)glucosamine N-acyltransferase [Candidatus Lokiarchaeota archaeon]